MPEYPPGRRSVSLHIRSMISTTVTAVEAFAHTPPYLVVNQGMSATFRWWVRVPEGWGALDALARRLLRLARPHVRGPVTRGP